jgi:hypothetical protein
VSESVVIATNAEIPTATVMKDAVALENARAIAENMKRMTETYC